MDTTSVSTVVRITIWNEFLHERENELVASLYPDGMHGAILDGIERYPGLRCRTATLDQERHGLTHDVLSGTDVLVWWGHMAHDEVDPEVVDDVCQQVLSGMGLVVLHSAHYSQVFRRLMGTNCSLRWREAGEKERMWNLAPSHPVMDGIGDYIELDSEEMYGERFDIPDPDDLLMISWFEGGEIFRSCCTWQRGHGRIVYLRPGHETYPTYYDPNIRRIIKNACVWARRRVRIDTRESPSTEPPEPLEPQEGKKS
jgi:trehalose utilization protein